MRLAAGDRHWAFRSARAVKAYEAYAFSGNMNNCDASVIATIGACLQTFLRY